VVNFPTDPLDPNSDAIFAATYLKTGDAAEACQRAGLANFMQDIRVTAEEQLHRPEIQALLKTMGELMPVGDVEITREYVVTSLERIHKSATNDKQYQSAIAALKVLAQVNGYLDTTVNVNHRLDLTNMTDAQLAKIAAGKAIEGEFKQITQETRA
jgi:hypothetical protein